MGVPSLYKWITMRYPEIKLSLNNTDEYLADILYLDFNAIIHPCCDKSLENMQDTDSQLYKNLENFLEDVLEKVRPRNLLYISVDGVAPRAKLNQQRSRRFTHAKEVLEGGKIYFKDDCGSTPSHYNSNVSSEEIEEFNQDPDMVYNSIFDTNAITPGTEFMQRLDCFIQELINYKMSTSDRWKYLNVIYSGYKVPGEGEQKIMEYIRKHQNKNQNMIIFSPDADLIFLGLTLFDYNVKILREEPVKSEGSENGRIWSLVDIPKLRNLLVKQFKACIRIPFDYGRFLEDWVFLCFTLGNDFLPCTPCFEIRANAIDKITQLYQNVFLRTKSYITQNGKINFNVLREFFKECANKENEFIIEKRNNLFITRRRMNLPVNPLEEFYLDNERGKIRFYCEKMGIKSEAELVNACKEYIKGLQWVYSYYFYDILSWDWFYPYHFAPFMEDLALVKEFSCNFTMGRPLKPLEQLLNVLPPLSKDLLPACLTPIFDQLKQYYPTDFKLDTFQKCMDWQAVAILPFINSKDIIKAFEEKQALLTYEELERNITGYPLFFSRHPKIIAKVYPMYTELKICENVTFDEFNGRIYTLSTFRALEEEVNQYGFRYTNRVVRFSFDQRKVFKKAKY